MTSRRSLLICVLGLLPILVACGGSTAVGGAGAPGLTSSTTSPSSANTNASSLPGATTLNGASTSASTSSRAGSIDVCALLSQDDAAAVARARGLNGAQTAATKYTLTAKKVESSGTSTFPMSSCEFNINGEGASGTIVIQVVPGDNITAYSSGKKVPGLGDEAYSEGGTTVVRVGDLMLETSENSFTQGFAVELYRKMIPKMR